MHQGKRSEELGIPGIPNICEAVQIARDVLLALTVIIMYVTYRQKRVSELFVMLKRGIHVTVKLHHIIYC